MGIKLGNIKAPDGTQSNMGGTAQEAYVIPISDVDQDSLPLQDLEDFDGADLATLIECPEDFGLVVGKGFYKMYTTLDKSELMYESQGEQDGQSFLGKANLFSPGGKAELLGLMYALNNTKCLVIQKTVTGEFCRIGTLDLPCNLKGSWAASTTGGEVRGIKLEGTAPMKRPLHYTGAIVVHTPTP